MDYDILSEVKHISEWLNPLGEELYRRKDTPDLPLTSLPEFNKLIWGIRPKALTIIGARTSQGKSSFALQIAYDLSASGKSVWLLSLEMDVPSLIERLFCHVMEVDNVSVLTGQFKMDKGIQQKYLKFKELMQDSKLVLTCGLGKTWEEIESVIETIKDKPDVIIVDYVQNIVMKSGDTRETINEYIRKFRNMAVTYGFAGILCSQINRGAEQQKDNEPSISQLKESGFLEESADVVMLLHWKAFYSGNTEGSSDYSILVAKNRNGKTGRFPIIYTPKFYRFTEKGTKPVGTFVEVSAEHKHIADIFGGRVTDENLLY